MTEKTDRILLCAATRWESEPLAAALRLVKTFDRRWEGTLAGRSLVLVQTGMGPVKTGERLIELSDEEFGVALSVGFAGALQPQMFTGDIVCDARGSDADLPGVARAISSRKGLALHFGKIAHSDRVVASPEDKLSMGVALRASAVDMETQALRAWADERELPVLAVRVVLDSVDERLPSAVPDGEDFVSLARFAARSWRDLPSLMTLGLRQKRAIARLASFLVELLPKL